MYLHIKAVLVQSRSALIVRVDPNLAYVAGRDNESNQRVNYESTRAALAAFGLTTAG